MSFAMASHPEMHVFVLMLENRSFDHIFGKQNLTGFDPAGQPTNANGLDPLPADFSNNYNGKSFPPRVPAVDPLVTDPGHEFLDTLEQLTGSKVNPMGIGGMVGNNRTGVAVYNGNHVAVMNSYDNQTWYQMNPSPFPIQGMVGENSSGVAAYNGTSFAVIRSYDSRAWTLFPDAPFAIQGMVGNNQTGVAIYNGAQFAVMNSYDDRKWYTFPNAPFPIAGMVGENSSGVAVFNGKKFAVMNSYDNRKWYPFPDAPFEIQGMVGDNRNGVAIYNGKKFAVMNSYDDRKWYSFPDAPFEIQGMVGDNRSGVAIYNGAQFAVMNSYDDRKWYSFPNAPFEIQGMVGDNRNGVAIYTGNRLTVMRSYDDRKWQEMASGPFVGATYPKITNSGFAQNYATSTSEGMQPVPQKAGDTISCATSDQVLVLSALANNFVLCDNWFASVPGPTWPNRLFAMGASSSGMDRSPTRLDLASFRISGFKYEKGSIFDSLTRAKIPWRVYNDDTNAYAGVPPSFFGSKAIAYFLEGMRQPTSLTQFERDLNTPGGYPFKFTFIEPNYGHAYADTYSGGSSQHPIDGLAAGERLIFDVYSKIRNSPVWPNSMLIITYDEHGGFFDHVAPPSAVAPADGAGNSLNSFGFEFGQLGVRVPAVIVSPRVKHNTIDHTLYDHTSILRTVEDFFGLGNLTQRDGAANSLSHLLTSSARSDRADVPQPAGAVPRSAPVSEDDSQPIPETSNIWGFLMLAAKQEFEMTGKTPGDEAAIAARLDQIETMGEARAFVAQVEQRAFAFRRAAEEATEL